MSKSPHENIKNGEPVLPQVKVTKIFVIKFRSDDIKKIAPDIKKIVRNIKAYIQGH
jgi:hypothetical protein